MIILEMYLDGQLLDKVKPCPYLSSSHYNGHVKSLKEELMKKHQALLSRSGNRPAFVLSGIPSRINHFTPLGK